MNTETPQPLSRREPSRFFPFTKWTLLASLILTLLSAAPASAHIIYTVNNTTSLQWVVRINWINANNVTAATTFIVQPNQVTDIGIPSAAVHITAVRIKIPANLTVRAVAGCEGIFHPQFNVTNCQCPDYLGHRFKVDFDHWNCDNCADGPPCPQFCGSGTCDGRSCTITEVN